MVPGRSLYVESRLSRELLGARSAEPQHLSPETLEVATASLGLIPLYRLHLNHLDHIDFLLASVAIERVLEMLCRFLRHVALEVFGSSR